MADPFATALAALHSAAGSVAAIFTPAGGSPTDIRVIFEQGTREVPFGEGAALGDFHSAQIQRSDVEQPLRGDALSVGNARRKEDVTVWTDFAIQGGARLDTEGLSWLCYLEPAA